MITYEAVPDGYTFSSTFDTYILGYCPDTLSWFATNQRFFYFEYDKEFSTKEEAEKYFREHAKEFYEIELKITDYRPSFADKTIYLDISAKEREQVTVD